MESRLIEQNRILLYTIKRTEKTFFFRKGKEKAHEYGTHNNNNNNNNWKDQ